MLYNNVKLYNGDGYNEHSHVTISNGFKDFKCHVCGVDNVKLICTDNSEGDNDAVAICKACCLRLFNV